MEWADGRAVRRGVALPIRTIWGLGGGADGKGGKVPVRPALGVIVVGFPDAEERYDGDQRDVDGSPHYESSGVTPTNAHRRGDA